MAKANNGEEKSFLFRAFYFTVQVTSILLIITLIPGLPPDVQFRPYKLQVKAVPLNGKLNNAEILFLNEVKGPEDIAIYRDEIYTTTHGGYVQRIHQGKLYPIVKFGKDCGGLFEEHICGRPLGLRFDSKKNLYVADAYYGIFKVNMSSGAFDYSTLVSIKEPIDGVLPTLPNCLAVSEKTGDVYWTDSSTSHKLYDIVYSILHNGNGRVLKYNAAKNKNEVLLNNLHFPNGIALSKDESFLVFAETFTAKLHKIYLKGPKSGQTEVFAELPGFPDNVHSINGKFGVAIINVPDMVFESLAEWPIIRKLISRVLTIFELVIDEIEALYPCECLRKLSHAVGHLETIDGLITPGPVILLYYNEDGKLVETLSSTDGKISGISSFYPHQKFYYLGSPTNNYLARVKIA